MKPEQLGFFSLLSIIWLEASLSLLAIADEREVFEHERLLFLHVIPYIAAKTAFYCLLATVQTACFFLTLWGLLPPSTTMRLCCMRLDLSSCAYSR